MNAKRVTAAAGVIHASQVKGKQTAAGIAADLESAQLLQSPETAAELYDLRTRLAAMANPPREVFLALYDGAEPELFTTVEAARECCDDLATTDAHGKCWDWTVNEHGIHVQFWTHPDDDRPMGDTSGYVTPIVVQGDEPLSEMERLRSELEAARVDGQRLIRAEQRTAELEAVLATHRKDDQAEIERLRARVAEAVATVASQAQKIAQLERIANAERSRVAELEAEKQHRAEALVRCRMDAAEQAQRETDPARRAAWRMLAEHRPPDGITQGIAPTQALSEDGAA